LIGIHRATHDDEHVGAGRDAGRFVAIIARARDGMAVAAYPAFDVATGFVREVLENVEV
jgi:hypothetical protein